MSRYTRQCHPKKGQMVKIIANEELLRDVGLESHYLRGKLTGKIVKITRSMHSTLYEVENDVWNYVFFKFNFEVIE